MVSKSRKGGGEGGGEGGGGGEDLSPLERLKL